MAVIAMQSGPLGGNQLRWVVVLAAGTGAVLGGLTAAPLDGLTG